MRVLVVDDNRDVADSEALLLRLWGHDVSVARDGHEAMQIALRDLPDVILLDIGLPHIDGWKVAQQLKKKESTSHCLLVAITGLGHATDRVRSKEAGFHYHFLKPVNPDNLKVVLDTYQRLDKNLSALNGILKEAELV